MEKYGFVYIWYDNAKSKQNGPDKIKRYYIGCHWGTEDDGYICSSKWMRDAYRRRPDNFKRRIVTKVSTRESLSDEELKWLSLIKEEELGKKYYNLRNCKINYHISKNFYHTEETKQKISETMSKVLMGNQHWLGKHHSQTAKDKVSEARKGKPLSQEHCEKLSQSHKGYKWKTNEFGKRIFYRENILTDN